MKENLNRNIVEFRAISLYFIIFLVPDLNRNIVEFRVSHCKMICLIESILIET